MSKKIQISIFFFFLFGKNIIGQKWLVSLSKGYSFSNSDIGKEQYYLANKKLYRENYIWEACVERKVYKNIYLGVGAGSFRAAYSIHENFSNFQNQLFYNQKFWFAQISLSKLIELKKFKIKPHIAYQPSAEFIPIQSTFVLPKNINDLSIRGLTSRLQIGNDIVLKLNKSTKIGFNISYNVSLEPIYINIIDNIQPRAILLGFLINKEF